MLIVWAAICIYYHIQQLIICMTGDLREKQGVCRNSIGLTVSISLGNSPELVRDGGPAPKTRHMTTQLPWFQCFRKYCMLFNRALGRYHKNATL